MTRLPVLLASLSFLGAAPAMAASLTITVAGIHDNRGHIRIGVCTKAEFLSEHCSYHALVPSQAGSTTTTITGITPGTYAVAAYQDSTDAGHLRRTMLGIPKDGTGFSHDPSLVFGAPGFAKCAFAVGPQDGAVTLTLHYF